MKTKSFTETLLAFTTTHKCTRLWLETVVEWVYCSCPALKGKEAGMKDKLNDNMSVAR